jgi:hypothetical protein
MNTSTREFKFRQREGAYYTVVVPAGKSKSSKRDREITRSDCSALQMKDPSTQEVFLKYGAGSQVIMTHQERQAFLANSEYGKVLGLKNLT